VDKPNEFELLTRIAWMYYFGKMRQQDIADKLDLSRIKIARSLKSAQDKGIVNISISDANTSLYSLEQQLTELSDLSYAVVVPYLPDLFDSICRGAGHLLNDLIDSSGTLGVGLSRTLHNVARYMDKEQINFSSVVAICGMSNPRLATHLNMGMGIAEAMSIDYYPILAPLRASPHTDAGMIKRDQLVSSVLKMAEQVDIALVGIGAMHDSELTEMSSVTVSERREIDNSGCIGEIVGNYFTIDGKIIITSTNERLICATFPMRCPVIAAAGGPSKVVAMVGAIRSGLIQGLVTDEQTARKAIALLESS
jgi:lsr operon transcriptional repressor